MNETRREGRGAARGARCTRVSAPARRTLTALAHVSAPARRMLTALARAAWLLVIAAFFPGCQSVEPMRDIRATFIDESGKPIREALLYAEAVNESGAFAYVWERAGEAGEVPKIAIRALRIPWERGAKLTLVGLAPGRASVIVRDSTDALDADGIVLEMRAAPDSTATWNPELAELQYPFAPQSALRRQLLGPGEAALREAFAAAWAAHPDSTARRGPSL